MLRMKSSADRLLSLLYLSLMYLVLLPRPQSNGQGTYDCGSDERRALGVRISVAIVPFLRWDPLRIKVLRTLRIVILRWHSL